MKLGGVFLRDRCEAVVGAAACPCFLFNWEDKRGGGLGIKEIHTKRLKKSTQNINSVEICESHSQGKWTVWLARLPSNLPTPNESLKDKHTGVSYFCTSVGHSFSLIPYIWMLFSSRNSLGFVDWLAVSHCGMPPGGPGLHIHSDAHSQSEHNHHQIDEQEDDECFHRKFNIVIWCALPQPSELRISWQIFGGSTESRSTLPNSMIMAEMKRVNINQHWFS